MITRILAALLLMACAASAEVSVTVHYLRQEVEQPPVLSNLDPVPGDLGLAGARLGLNDNATTGRFLGQSYALEVTEVPLDGDLMAAARAALAQSDLIVMDAPAEALLRVADLPEAAGALIFNASAPDRRLRDTDCRANVLHTADSHSMRTDALAQFMVKRRWTRLALIEGTHPEDAAFAEALRTSLTKFQLRLVSEKTWAFDADMRRNAAQEVPLFTQDLKDHHLLLIADEIHDFGRYIAYNTWEPRPVAGSEGLVPQAWSGVVEQWGAAQLQSRFHDLAGRSMRSRDYAAWAALSTIGEAVTRTGSGDTDILRGYILGPEFELSGFKGRPLSFRPWNGQLRQPIPLVTERAVVAQAPLEGFLHRVSELDTLGLDEPESRCTAFGN
ncbi:ABC transporter substrate-binding protein [Antarctobacter jejuensis]|uniref:ABC transporter substrate-binding protein n=1 Tax=Antarctobacter jejuensis TaxID=1439938 RepID=UPI003FD0B5E2